MTDNARQCAQIHRQSFPKGKAWNEADFHALLTQPSVALYQQEGAFLLTRIAADEMEILTIAVLPERRRRSIATKLMQQALREAENQGVRQCFLEVSEHNQAAIACYASLEFEVISVRERYYKDKDGSSDGLVMQCLLREILR